MFSPATRKGAVNAVAEEEHMRLSGFGYARHHFALAVLLTVVVLQLFPLVTHAQNLGQQPATGQAVQGQTAAQPEGTKPRTYCALARDREIRTPYLREE